MIHIGLVETTKTIPVRFKVMYFVKKLFAIYMLTNPISVDEFELKMFHRFAFFDSLDTFSGNLSSFIKFVFIFSLYLFYNSAARLTFRSFIKFVFILYS